MCTKTKTVGFSITGEFITEHSRNLWSEHKYTQALDVLECVLGTTQEQHEAVLFGKMKFSGVNRITLVKDSWTPPAHYCASLKEALRRGESYDELLKRREREAYDYAYENWDSSRYSQSDRDSYFAFVKKLVGHDKAEEIVAEVMEDTTRREVEERRDRIEKAERKKRTDPVLHATTLAAHHLKIRMELAGFDSSAMATPESIVNRGRDIVPVLDRKMENSSGWLLRNGDFYGCKTMEHIGLAEALIPDSPNAEKEAEDKGWVKIAKTFSGTYCCCSKKPTKQQLNKIFDYAQLHGKDYEELVGTLGMFSED